MSVLITIGIVLAVFFGIGLLTIGSALIIERITTGRWGSLTDASEAPGWWED